MKAPLQRLGILILMSLAGNAAAADWRTPLHDPLDGPSFAPDGGLYYRENFEQSAGTVEFQKEEVSTGTAALKLSVRPICPAAKDGCSERAEIWEKTALRVPYNQGIWYGFSVKFAEPVPQDDHRYLIAQWKREIDSGADGDFSPFLALRLRNGKLFATVETNYVSPSEASSCAQDAAKVWLRKDSNQMRALVATDWSWTPEDSDMFAACSTAIKVVDHGNPLPRPGAGWTDFAIYTQPGPDGSGRIDIFADGKPVVTVTGHIGHADKGLGRNQYFKFGPYRAAGEGIWTMYYDNFRRSPKCSDVLTEAPCPA